MHLNFMKNIYKNRVSKKGHSIFCGNFVATSDKHTSKPLQLIGLKALTHTAFHLILKYLTLP
jgi:hypothetical protein